MSHSVPIDPLSKSPSPSAIETRVRKEKALPQPPVRPKLGSLYTYRIVSTIVQPSVLKIDQGFHKYCTAFEPGSKLKAGDIAESRKTGDGSYSAVPTKRGAEDLFTYKAFLERVVDADTFFVEIDLGFGGSLRDYLRLRALNAPEMSTPEGLTAKAFAESLLKPAPFILLTSTRSDKYHRYLADVFIPGKKFLRDWAKGKAVLEPSAGLLHLNNELLARGFAVRAD